MASEFIKQLEIEVPVFLEAIEATLPFVAQYVSLSYIFSALSYLVFSLGMVPSEVRRSCMLANRK
jgi:hypothetical protein